MFQVSRRFKRFELLGRFPPFPNSSKGWQFRDDIGAGDMAERNPARLFETWNQKCWKFQTAAADKSPCQKFLKALRRRPWDWLDVRHVSTTFLLLPPSRPGLKPRSLCFLMEFGRNLRGWTVPEWFAAFMETKNLLSRNCKMHEHVTDFTCCN